MEKKTYVSPDCQIVDFVSALSMLDTISVQAGSGTGPGEAETNQRGRTDENMWGWIE